MSAYTYTFTKDQIEAIAYLIKSMDCTFREAYAACHETNYNRLEAKQKIADLYEERRMAHKLKRMERN